MATEELGTGLGEAFAAAARRRPWIGDHGFCVDDDCCIVTFYWFRTEAEAHAMASVVQEPYAEDDDTDEVFGSPRPIGYVAWIGPVESLMHGRHEVAARARYWFWLSLDPDDTWPFVGDVEEGWGEWVVRAVSEDELAAFGAFLAETRELRRGDWED